MLKEYFNKSVFVKGLDHPFSSNIAPSVDMSSLSEEELNNIKFGIYRFKDFTYSLNEYDGVITGKVRLFEKNNGRRISDDVSFETFIDFQDTDLIKVDTEVRVDRFIEGDNHELVSVRDGMFPIGYQDISYEFGISEYFMMTYDGTRVIHYSDNYNGYEVYELNNEYDLMSGLKLNNVIVIKDHDLDKESPLLDEINQMIMDRKEVLQLIRR